MCVCVGGGCPEVATVAVVVPSTKCIVHISLALPSLYCKTYQLLTVPVCLLPVQMMLGRTTATPLGLHWWASALAGGHTAGK